MGFLDVLRGEQSLSSWLTGRESDADLHVDTVMTKNAIEDLRYLANNYLSEQKSTVATAISTFNSIQGISQLGPLGTGGFDTAYTQIAEALNNFANDMQSKLSDAEYYDKPLGERIFGTARMLLGLQVSEYAAGIEMVGDAAVSLVGWVGGLLGFDNFQQACNDFAERNFSEEIFDWLVPDPSTSRITRDSAIANAVSIVERAAGVFSGMVIVPAVLPATVTAIAAPVIAEKIRNQRRSQGPSPHSETSHSSEPKQEEQAYTPPSGGGPSGGGQPRKAPTPTEAPTEPAPTNAEDTFTPIDTPPVDVTPTNTTPVGPSVGPSSNTPSNGQFTGTGYSETSDNLLDSAATSIEEILKGNKYSKVPTSTAPIGRNIGGSTGSAVIPVSAGIATAAAAGIGAKAYVDKKSEEEEDEYQDNWGDELEIAPEKQEENLLQEEISDESLKSQTIEAMTGEKLDY